MVFFIGIPGEFDRAPKPNEPDLPPKRAKIQPMSMIS